jgi:putative colanic acid biosynthesis glycosyltransferase
MKVLQINSVCGIGSTGRIATDIDSKLRENNIESYIAYGRETSIDNDHVLKIGTKLDYYVHGGLTRIFDTHALWGSRRATIQFIKRLKDINPDVIHLHNLHGYFINIKILFNYLKETGKPVVWTLHDCWSFTGHCAHFSYAKCDKWKTGCNKCLQKGSYPASAFLDNSRRNYDIKKRLFTSLENMTIVTPSQWLADLVKQSFLAKYPVRVIHNGIDTNVFKPANGDVVRKKYGLMNKFIILGVANIWDDRKGLRHFIKLSQMVDADCVILLVGLNDQQITELPQNTIGIKRTASVTELVDIYSAADVFINPTLEDNFPTVNLEALACGTPLVTFNTGGSPESLDHGCGYIVEIGNLDDINMYISQIKNEGKALYSERCVKRVKDHFDKKDRFKEYVELYQRLGKWGKKC